MTNRPRTILVAGATGYVGARLVQRLADEGHRVRAMGRTWRSLQRRPWATDPRIDLVTGDVLDAGTLARVLKDVEVVYYLVHSMDKKSDDFAGADRKGARNMAEAAAAAGVSRIVYLGGLGDEGADLSHHLRSRAEVARIFAEGPVPTTTLRAAIVIGAGSASFEILRFLADRLPVMVTPRWLKTRVQPIAIEDVLRYLVGCLDAPSTVGGTFDIGGPDVTNYRELLAVYAKEAGLRKRLILSVPVLTPRLSAHWIQLVTPAPMALVRPLAEGLRNPVVCKEDAITRAIPFERTSTRAAIRHALNAEAPDPSARMEGDASWTDHSSWLDAFRKVGRAKRRPGIHSEDALGDERKVVEHRRAPLDRDVVVQPDHEPIFTQVDAREEFRRRAS